MRTEKTSPEERQEMEIAVGLHIVESVYGVIIQLYYCGWCSTRVADDAVRDNDKSSSKLF